MFIANDYNTSDGNYLLESLFHLMVLNGTVYLDHHPLTMPQSASPTYRLLRQKTLTPMSLTLGTQFVSKSCRFDIFSI